MGNTEIFTANKGGAFKSATVFVDDTQGCLHVWQVMSEEYLKKPLTANSSLEEIFTLIGAIDIPYEHRLVLASTLDHAIVYGRNLKKFVEALRVFTERWPTKNLLGQLAYLETLEKEEISAVAWNQSSDIKMRWKIRNNGRTRKYNWRKDRGHFSVFKLVPQGEDK